MIASSRRAVSAVAICCVAVATQRAATSAWASAAAADGTRYTLSPVGVSRAPSGPPSDAAARPSSSGSPLTVEDCRWWPRYGDQSLCAVGPGAEGSFVRLRLAYPLLLVALWTAVLSLLLQVIRVPASATRQAVLPAAVCVCTLLAIVFLRRAPDALTALRGLSFDFGTVGFWLAVAAAGLSAVSATLLLAKEPRAVPEP